MQVEVAFQRLRDANPVPDPAALRRRPAEPSAFLIATQQRSRAMQTQVKPIPTVPAPRPPRRNWVPALAAAFVVALIGISIALFTRGGEPDVVNPNPNPPDTLVTTTVAQVDPSAGAVAVALSFVEARDLWDADTMSSLVASNALITGDRVTDKGLVNLANMDQATGTRYSSPQCSESSPGTVRCTYSGENDISRARQLDAFSGSFVFVIEDGVIQQVTHNTNWGAEFLAEVLEPFRLWVAVNHPDDVALMYEDVQGGDTLARSTPEAIELWQTHTAEYVASLGGTP